MTRTQQRIGSGFTASSTASEVLDGIDLTGKLAIVTGGYSGLGKETVRALVGAGAHVVVPARRVDAARNELSDIGGASAGDGIGTGAGTDAGVEVDEMDLSDLASVHAFAERFLASGRSIDIIIDNAGVMAAPETRVGPGWELQFATNHLGHFTLVNLLWPAVVKNGSSRIVATSSSAHRRSPIRWDDIDFTTGYDKWEAYGQAKTANALFALQLDEFGKGEGVRAFSVHPGGILTPLQRHLERAEMVAAGWMDEDGNAINQAFKSPEQGAATQVWAATSPKLYGLGGLFLEDVEVAVPAEDAVAPASGVAAYAVDPAEAERLWTFSAERTGVNAFAS